MRASALVFAALLVGGAGCVGGTAERGAAAGAAATGAAATGAAAADSLARVVPGRYAVLSSEQAVDVVPQCSRDAPVADGTWALTADVVQALERDLPAVERLPAQWCCGGFPPEAMDSVRVTDVNASYRQYAGVVVGGRPIVYVNAYPYERMDAPAEKETAPLVVCDGGPDFWGVVYDPATGRFSDLAFNGGG